MPQMILPSNPLQRVQTFLAAYRAADDDDDLDVRIGRMEGGEPAVLLSINGTNHGFTASEARRLASVVEDGMNECPNDPEAASLPNLILALRPGAEMQPEGFGAMTTQPDRPDGDGLRTCPCCAGVSSFAEEWPGHLVACENARCGIRSGIFPTRPMARRAWNTRPTRDGAEGAACPVDGCGEVAGDTKDPRWDQGQCAQCGKWFWKSAPPKPATDAAALRHAPVPPADGAPSLGEAFIRLQRRLLAYCKHANAGHMPSDAREFTRRILLGFQSAYEEAGITPPVIEPETTAEYMESLRSPPCAGAAEPVATPQQVQEACAQVADRAAGSDEAWAAKYSDEAMKFEQRAHRAKTIAASIRAMISPVVAPPVRGDREAIARTLYECEKRRAELTQTVFEEAAGKPCPGAKMEPWDECKDVFLSDADALIAAGLVVPVPPGAGEREAAPDLCAGGVKIGWDECPKCRATSDEECKAPKSTAKTCLDDTGLKITSELYKAVSGHTGDACLLAMIGSWGDTLDDPDILAGLQRYNEMGECFIPDASSRQAPHSSSEGGR